MGYAALGYNETVMPIPKSSVSPKSPGSLALVPMSPPPRGIGVYFVLAVLSLGFIACPNASWLLRLWIGVFGLLVPWAIVVTLPPPSTVRPDIPSKSPFWVLALLIGVGFWFRFKDLTTFSSWPRVDEGLNDLIGIQLARRWDWSLFHLPAQMPPLYHWMLGLLYQVLLPSHALTALVPALWSFLAFLLLAFFMMRTLPAQVSWAAVALAAGSYWLCFIGRFSHPPVLMLALECALLALGPMILTRKPWAPWAAAALLALGTYSYFSWPLVFIAALGMLTLYARKKDLGTFGLPVLAAVIGILPILWAALRGGYGGYLRQLAQANPTLADRMMVAGSYLGGIFGPPILRGDYGPEWGGLLNPVTGALALCGLAWVSRKGAGPSRWVAVLAIGMLLPGFLTRTVQFFRISQAVPFWILLAGLGLEAVRRSLPATRRTPVLILVVASALACDAYHLFVAYPAAWAQPGPRWTENIKSIEYARAYPILEKLQQERGAGWILLFLQSDTSDATFFSETYRENLASNRGLKPPENGWTAVICDVHYQPFLRTRFHHARWFDLSEGLDRVDGGRVLGWIPPGDMPGGTLALWRKADQAGEEILEAFNRRKAGENYDSVLESWSQQSEAFGGDPFLRACWWEKGYYLWLQDGAFGGGDKGVDFVEARRCLEGAIRDGFPAAHLWNELGSMYQLSGEKEKAREAFRKAVASPLNRTAAAQNLESVGPGTAPAASAAPGPAPKGP